MIEKIPEKPTQTQTSEKPKAKAKPQKTEEPQTHLKGAINAYGFIHLSEKLREAWQVKKGTKTAITIELQGDTLIMRKA